MPCRCGTASAGMRPILCRCRRAAQHIQKNREDVVAIDASFSLSLVMTGRQQPASIVQVRIRSCAVMVLTERKHENAPHHPADWPGSLQPHEAYDIQDLRDSRSDEQEPNILPHIFHERYLDAPRDGMDLRLRLSATNINNDEYTDAPLDFRALRY